MSKPSTRSGKAGPWNAGKLTRFAHIYNKVLQVLQNMQGNVMSKPHKQILKTALAPQVPRIGPKVMSKLWVADTFGATFGFVLIGALQTHTVRLLAQIASFLHALWNQCYEYGGLILWVSSLKTWVSFFMRRRGWSFLLNNFYYYY